MNVPSSSENMSESKSNATVTLLNEASQSSSKGTAPYGDAIRACAAINAQMHMQLDRKCIQKEKQYPIRYLDAQHVPTPLYSTPQRPVTTHAELNTALAAHAQS